MPVHCAFQIDVVADLELAYTEWLVSGECLDDGRPTEICSAERLWGETDLETMVVELCDGQTAAINRDRVANVTIAKYRGALANRQAPATTAAFGRVELQDG